MTEQTLVKKATRLFPILPSTPVRAVRHARRQWVRAAMQLQTNPPKRPFWRHIVLKEAA